MPCHPLLREPEKPRACTRGWPPHNKTMAQVWAEEHEQGVKADSWGRERQFRTTRSNGT